MVLAHRRPVENRGQRGELPLAGDKGKNRPRPSPPLSLIHPHGENPFGPPGDQGKRGDFWFLSPGFSSLFSRDFGMISPFFSEA